MRFSGLVFLVFRMRRATCPGEPHIAKTSAVELIVGRGELKQFPDFVERVSVAEPNIADLVPGWSSGSDDQRKAPGLTTALIWYKADWLATR